MAYEVDKPAGWVLECNLITLVFWIVLANSVV